jgi:hypothetical protein
MEGIFGQEIKTPAVGKKQIDNHQVRPVCLHDGPSIAQRMGDDNIHSWSPALERAFYEKGMVLLVFYQKNRQRPDAVFHRIIHFMDGLAA